VDHPPYTLDMSTTPKHTVFFRVLKHEADSITVVWALIYNHETGKDLPSVPPDRIVSLAYDGVGVGVNDLDFCMHGDYHPDAFTASRAVYKKDIECGFVPYEKDQNLQLTRFRHTLVTQIGGRDLDYHIGGEF
jgi:hypothetical protein